MFRKNQIPILCNYKHFIQIAYNVIYPTKKIHKNKTLKKGIFPTWNGMKYKLPLKSSTSLLNYLMKCAKKIYSPAPRDAFSWSLTCSPECFWQKIWLCHLHSEENKIARCEEKPQSLEPDKLGFKWCLCH